MIGSGLPAGMSAPIVAELPTGRLSVSVEPGAFAFDALLGLAARANPKRGFLFLSKVLAKHWPSVPSGMARVHDALAAAVPAGLPQPVLFIAMAETAVGLGQGVFEAWLARHPGARAVFVHTTRYPLAGFEQVEFEESHSHATRHLLHLPRESRAQARFRRAASLVLIDDEISTGNTFVNLASACLRLSPALGHIHLSTICDFLGAPGRAALLARLPRPGSLGALLRGAYTFAPVPIVAPAPVAQCLEAAAGSGATPDFGRAGLTDALALDPVQVERLAAGLRGRLLVLGTGEFMHAPYRLARALEARGFDVRVQSTTRSPILAGGAVGEILPAGDPYGEGVPNYLYNVRRGQYDAVLIGHETPSGPALRALAATLDARLVRFLPGGRLEGVSVR